MTACSMAVLEQWTKQHLQVLIGVPDQKVMCMPVYMPRLFRDSYAIHIYDLQYVQYMSYLPNYWDVH